MTDQTEVAKELLDSTTEIFGGINLPAPIKRNLFKALGQLTTAAVDIPVAFLEGKAAEKRAETDARVRLIKSSSDQIASQLKIDPNYAKAAANKFGQRIVREQINIDDISSRAIRRLEDANFKKDDETSSSQSSELSEDFLNEFETQARTVTSEELKNLFASILAQEITKPNSFAKRTLNVVGQLDSETALLFQKFCSCCISLELPNGQMLDVRVPGFGNAATNTLSQHGFSFETLNMLNEIGLIISDFNSHMEYVPAIIRSNSLALPFGYCNSYFGISFGEEGRTTFRMQGVGLTAAGKQLFKVVDKIENTQFTAKLGEWFASQGAQMIPVKFE